MLQHEAPAHTPVSPTASARSACRGDAAAPALPDRKLGCVGHAGKVSYIGP